MTIAGARAPADGGPRDIFVTQVGSGAPVKHRRDPDDARDRRPLHLFFWAERAGDIRVMDVKRWASSGGPAPWVLRKLNMHKINWSRVVLCGLGAALAWSALSLPILVVFGRALIEAAPPAPLLGADRAAAGFALNALAGIWAMWLYAALHPRYGAGPRTAAIGGFSWWLIGSIVTCHWTALGLIRFRDVIGVIIASLPVLVAVTMLAARAYQEKSTDLHGGVRVAGGPPQ